MIGERSIVIKDNINWEQFLGRHDLIWKVTPEKWEDAAFIGNGLMGATIYKLRNGRNMRFDIGRSDVVDHRDNEAVTDGKARLPIDKIELVTEGEILDGEMRLELWNAQTLIKIKTSKGEIELSSYIHAEKNVMVVEITTSAGENNCNWEWYPNVSVSPRKLQNNEPFKGGMNPFPIEEKVGDINVCVQHMLAGGDYATAWQEVVKSKGRKTLFLSVGYSLTNGRGRNEAINSIKDSIKISNEDLLNSHTIWWHEFYKGNSEDKGSFLSLPDTRLESFYWIQMYKLASATRADHPAIDLMGPWFYVKTPWPAMWWNLNIQLTYWPAYASNNLELGKSLCKMLDDNMENLILNVPEEYQGDSAAIGRVSSYDCRSDVKLELCNLPWTCHNYWLQYRYSMDDEMLQYKFFPLLRRSINYYIHLLKIGGDGKFHLPLSISPEYPDKAPDCNIDLSLIRWGCQTLIDICNRLNIEDTLISKWNEVLEKLVDYPVNENGLMIGTGVPFEKSHRHYSHLLMIYPLSIMNWEQVENRELIDKSLKHWMGIKGAHRGYSYTGASAISSRIGRGNDALDYLNKFLEQKDFPITRNTMYLEAGPVIETPFSAASSIQEMVLQSWGDKIRIFHAVPDLWKDVSFKNLRAEGAFLISAVRKEGKTQFIKIKSLAGEPCRIKTDFENIEFISEDENVSINLVGDGVMEINIKKDQAIILYEKYTKPDFSIEPVYAQEGRCNYFGSFK